MIPNNVHISINIYHCAIFTGPKGKTGSQGMKGDPGEENDVDSFAKREHMLNMEYHLE